MRKVVKIAGTIVIVAMVAVLAGVTIVSAQDEPATPDVPVIPDESAMPFRQGQGRSWGQGDRGVGRGLMVVDQETMHAAIADALGITVDEFEAAIAEGTRLSELAAELGIDLVDVQEAMQAVHEAALQQAVEDGLITQEQADAFGNRLGQMGAGNSFGPRRGFGGRGGFGDGFGFGPRGECPQLAPEEA
jgi:hypothetical protein